LSSSYAASGPRWRSHLGLPLDGVHPADELAVGLEQQQQLEVQLVEPAAQLQLLETETQQSSTPLREGGVRGGWKG